LSKQNTILNDSKQPIALNYRSNGDEFHHLHINNNHRIGVYIPRNVHKENQHASKTGVGMRSINKIALLTIAMQSSLPSGDASDYKQPVRRINITIDDDLYNWIKEYRDKNFPNTINVSAICNNGLKKAMKILELEEEIKENTND